MSDNKDAIKIIEKYNDKLKSLENSEGWYRYTLAIKELIDKDILNEDELIAIKKYKEQKWKTLFVQDVM